MEINWLKNLIRLNLPIYQYESDTMKIAYAGYSSIKRNYFVRLLLDRKNIQTYLGRRWFWQITKLNKSRNLDVVISEVSPILLNHFHKCHGVIVPEWVRMKINIDQPISEICKRSVSDFSDVKRKIRKYKLTHDILSDKESFCLFNDKFYLPYIKKRHGEEAWIEDLDSIWESSQAPLLIAVREEGMIVGAALIEKADDSLQLLRLGLLDGNDEYRRHGVIGAIYYFSVIEGQKMGCKFLDVGGTRPFITDGLTKFKIGLGAEFVSHISPTAVNLWLGINKHSAAATDFMKKNPVVHIKKDFSLVRPVR